jgi:hypothetical protein
MRRWSTLFASSVFFSPILYLSTSPKRLLILQVVTWVSLPTLPWKEWLGECRGIQENALEKGDVEERDLWKFCNVGTDRRIALLSDG